MRFKVLVLSLLALITLLINYLAETRNGYFDSKVYYGAIQYWFNGDGGMVYDWLRPGSPYGFTYPPFAGLVMSPMSVLPFGLVVVIAVVGTVLTTALLIYWFTGPLIARMGWPRWFALGIAICLAISFEPVRETITFGQVNTLLLTLVAGDMLFGVAKGRRWAGVGIGLATAIKLTPGIFIVYLLITRRWRDAATAAGTAAGATLVAGAIFPDETREFWTSALWDTNRVGVLSFLSNQSERGFLARLPIEQAESKVWLVCVLATLAFWAWRVRTAPADVAGGLALTGVVGCLISPVTWVHHCVYLIPALVRCVDAGLSGRDRKPLYLAGAAYLVMTSRVTWLWEKGPRPPLAIIGSNLYVYFSLALLIWTPIGTARSSDVKEPDKILT
ncbi:glycosyltransferase 87 family protein [Paractinoplanes durhamensis]|uniref:Membrane protein n=1 Tax=Paractinoplanes durhamensis TaxID=113563 RepID=A0ABQ3Z403_9ACTN|nr:glycosyltransferase 87 family protein [Actinoplanes durhamensis]GIE04553.1 membrane protein [Actinoplanes durhamensis]